MLEAWEAETRRRLGELICLVWGGDGSVRRCVLKSEIRELAIDVVDLRVIPQHFEHGSRLPAHGTLTIDVRTDDDWRALTEIARSKQAVVLQRPDFGALEMRLDDLATASAVKVDDGSQTRSTVTYSWRSP